jgi:hypothetical protein
MSKINNYTVSSAAALCVVLAFTIAAALPQTAESPSADSVGDINNKVLQLKANDPGSTGELVDSVLMAHGITRQVLAGTRGVRDQIVQAEIGYHNGTRRGVSETDVARVINNLSSRFSAPEYTRTSRAEIRQLRVQMMLLHPALIGLEPAFKGSRARGASLGDEMSPIEAIHVTATMIFQKMYNPEWQLNKIERQARWKARHTSSYQPDFSDQTRSKEVLSAIRTSASSMSLRDGLAIATDSLSIMGIGGIQ